MPESKFSNVSQNTKIIHLHLYLLPEKDRQVRRDRFYSFKETNVKQKKTSNAPRHDIGATFASAGTLLLPFRFYLGRVGRTFAPFSIFYGALSTWPRFNNRLPIGTLTKETPAAILSLHMRWAIHSRESAYAWNCVHFLLTQSFHLHSMSMRQLRTPT